MKKTYVWASPLSKLCLIAALFTFVSYGSALPAGGPSPNGKSPCSDPDALEGYSDKISVAQGESINFFVNSPQKRYYIAWQSFRTWAFNFGPIGDWKGPTRQDYNKANCWQEGMNWTNPFTFRIPDAWPSGLYAAHLVVDGTGNNERTDYAIPFVVKEKKPGGAKALVLASTNVWQAYNGWGGGSLYPLTNGWCCYHVVSMDRPFQFGASDNSLPIGHTWGGETNFLEWLDRERYNYAMASDADLDSEPELLTHYRVVIISTHSEYWTQKMYDNLEAFLRKGGNLFYFSGNGLYWKAVICGRQIEVHKDGKDNELCQTPESDKRGGKWIDLGRPEAKVTGLQFEEGAGYCYVCSPSHQPTQTCPQQLCQDKDHSQPFVVSKLGNAEREAYEGTGVAEGAAFGDGESEGWCGKRISTWEVDGLPDKSNRPDDFVVLATGKSGDSCNPYGAGMGYYKHRGGGIVFSIGSINTGRVLLEDAILSQVVKNMFRRVGITPSQ